MKNKTIKVLFLLLTIIVLSIVLVLRNHSLVIFSNKLKLNKLRIKTTFVKHVNQFKETTKVLHWYLSVF